MLGKILPYVIIGLVDVVIIVLVAVFWFRVPLHGSLTLLMASSTIFLLGALGIGLFLSAATKNQQVAFQLAVLITMLPSLLLSGFFYPIENMPPALGRPPRPGPLLPGSSFADLSRGWAWSSCGGNSCFAGFAVPMLMASSPVRAANDPVATGRFGDLAVRQPTAHR
jgi:ABC-type multidrug transport system permease subunit